MGGDRFAVEIGGPFSTNVTPALIKDLLNGTYEVSWSTDTAGELQGRFGVHEHPFTRHNPEIPKSQRTHTMVALPRFSHIDGAKHWAKRTDF